MRQRSTTLRQRSTTMRQRSTTMRQRSTTMRQKIHSPETKIHNTETNIHSPETKIHSPETKIHSLETKIHNPDCVCLQVEDISIQFATEGPEKTREECCPGRPLISFSVRPSVKLRLTNPQPQNGLFSHILSVGEGDTVAKLAARLARENKLINDAGSIELWRYKDVKLGPRQFPVYGKPTSGAVLIEKEAVFHADVDSNSLDISLNGSKYPVGPAVIYIVK
uniref:Leucine--tRNA ligase ubiquitin-like domain-containing protein n=1 Tax=Timema poppense TaxID=170557 RepID=A0A7R9DBT5_TIMPO|nr:unnamed protein product [Timema poppensis]